MKFVYQMASPDVFELKAKKEKGMLPISGRAYHDEKTRRFLAEVNRDVERSRDSAKSSVPSSLSHKLGEYLISLGESLTRTARLDPS